MSTTFYIYSDGADIEATAPEMRERIEGFIGAYAGRVRVVDRREEKKDQGPDLPDWEFGVNFEGDRLTDAEKKDLLLFFQSLSAEFSRDFVVGFATRHGQSEDIAFVSAADSLEPAIEVLLETAKRGNQSQEPTLAIRPFSGALSAPCTPSALSARAALL